MQFNFITIAINAAKHPAINSLPHGLRLIIRLMEIHGPQRESSILSGQEATNQWLGNGGLSKYQISSGLDRLEKILIETDAPFLAPHPFRGKRNLPEYIIKVAEKVPEIKNVSVEEVARITTENSKNIFGI